MNGGIHAEWMVTCGKCNVDVEPGRFYNTKAQAMEVMNRAVKHESWLLTNHGKLLCPECAELIPAAQV